MCYLSQFSVKNYKCLRDVTLPLTPFHVLIGENDAGKSSFLEAIAAYCAAKKHLALRECFEATEFGPDLLGTYANEDEPIEFVGRWSASRDPNVSDWLEYGFAFKIAPDRTGIVVNEYVCGPNAAENSVRSTIREHLALGTYAKNPAAQQLRNEDRPLLERATRFVQTADLYALNPRVMALPSLRSSEKKFKMDRDGFGLANLLDDIIGRNPETFLEVRKEFSRYFPQFESVALEAARGLRRNPDHTGTQVEGGKQIVFQTKDGHDISARNASDGAIIFLAYLALSYLPEPPGVLLIEEPENSVYPKRLGEIIALLRRYSAENSGRPAPQIIVTTHSPFVVSHFQPEEVSFFYRSREHLSVAEAKPLRDVPGLKQRLDRDDLYLGELWYNWDEEAWLGIPARSAGSD